MACGESGVQDGPSFGSGQSQERSIDPTPERLDGSSSQEFEPEDIERAENASDEVKEYCSDAVSEANGSAARATLMRALFRSPVRRGGLILGATAAFATAGLFLASHSEAHPGNRFSRWSPLLDELRLLGPQLWRVPLPRRPPAPAPARRQRERPGWPLLQQALPNQQD